ncbi:hypothetical protein ACFPYN_14100 [Paenisporosarcina macmurdoensis]|uniref:DUF3347 domain-containing protein n=1 Tax=Paenisporosarcina macmurdoensis TaxID=212659 RepID=A0ABW1L980_9BACL
MKKIFTILLTVSLFLGLSTSVFASSNEDYTKGIQLIELANLSIDEMIAQGVAEADELQGNFLIELGKVEAMLESATDDKQVAKLNEEKGKLNTKYNEKLDEIIERVYEETLQLSNETLAKAAEYGVMAECSWVLVEFADRSVLIDPLRIVGEY